MEEGGCGALPLSSEKWYAGVDVTLVATLVVLVGVVAVPAGCPFWIGWSSVGSQHERHFPIGDCGAAPRTPSRCSYRCCCPRVAVAALLLLLLPPAFMGAVHRRKRCRRDDVALRSGSLR